MSTREGAQPGGGNNKKASWDLGGYREHLMQAYQKASESYDKAVITLSGGTLAISLTFVRDVVHGPKTGTLPILAYAWACLCFSVVAILTSMVTSQSALRKAMNQIDRRQERDLMREPGGWYSWLTLALNIGALVAFIAGIVFLAWFAIDNMGAIRGSGTSPNSS
jgi:uncharacterized BrkB/YihY/UPF0761 family membrane protein